MTRLDRDKAAALLPWNLPRAMSTEEWFDALEACIAPEAPEPYSGGDEPKVYEVRLIAESYGSEDDVRSTVYDRLSPTGLMPKAIRVEPKSAQKRPSEAVAGERMVAPLDAVAMHAEAVLRAALEWHRDKTHAPTLTRAEWELFDACDDYGTEYRGLRAR